MRRRAFVVLALVGVWWMRRGGETQLEGRHPVMAAVTPAGFAALTGPVDVHDSRHVIEVSRDGEDERSRPLRLAAEVRLVGTKAGPAIGWIEGARMKLGTLDDDGRPTNVTNWGKKATMLCDGAASNDLRFGVGWLESDGRVWFVHGFMNRLASDDIDATEVATKGEWCGIASAEGNVVLMWRENGRLVMNFCGPRDCTSGLLGVPLDRGDALLGFGCVSDACLFAARDKRGIAKLVRVNIKGRVIVKTLDDAAESTGISVTGAGNRAFAIAYTAKDERTTIRRVGIDGDFTHVYHFEKADFAPSLAWAADKLAVVVTRYDRGKLYVLDLPR